MQLVSNSQLAELVTLASLEPVRHLRQFHRRRLIRALIDAGHTRACARTYADGFIAEARQLEKLKTAL